MAHQTIPKLFCAALAGLALIAVAAAADQREHDETSHSAAFVHFDLGFVVDPPTPPTPPNPPAPPTPPTPPEPPPPPHLIDLDLDFDFEFDGDLHRESDDEDDTAHDDETTGERRSSGKLTIDELISLRVHDVTPEYIEEMRAIFPDASLKQIASMRMHDVTAAFVKQLSDSGHRNLTARELIRLAAARKH